MSKSKVYDRKKREARWKEQARGSSPQFPNLVSVSSYAGVWYYRDSDGQYYREHKRDRRGFNEVSLRDLPPSLR